MIIINSTIGQDGIFKLNLVLFRGEVYDMAKTETEFSKYAQAFREVIDGNKTYKTILTKDLLKMGLTDLDKDYINTKYPTYTDNIGKRHIEDNKGSGLLKYYEGANDLSNLISNLETEFDEEFRERYCEELQDYDELKIMKFAHSLNIAEDTDDFDEISEAIAEYYSSLIKRAASKKRRKTKTSTDTTKTGSNSIELSYTFTELEKKALVNLCKLNNNSLLNLEYQIKNICDKQQKLLNLNNSEQNELLKDKLQYDIDSLNKHFIEIYHQLEEQCNDMVELLKPKKHINANLDRIISIAKDIISYKNKIKSIDIYVLNYFSLIRSRFDTAYIHLSKVIDKL